MHQKKCPDRRLHPALIYSPIKPILTLFAILSTNTSPTQIIALSLFTCLLFSLSPLYYSLVTTLSIFIFGAQRYNNYA